MPKGNPSLVTPPTEEPVTIEEVMFDIRDAPDEDLPNLRSLIIAARERVETHLKRQIITATYDWHLECFYDREIQLPKPPLQSVTSINYVDTGGTTQILDPATYLVDIYSEAGRIAPTWDQMWPVTRPQMNAVTIRFVCGYGQADEVPESIKRAISWIARAMYEGCFEEADLDRVVSSILSSEVWGCYA